MFLMSHFIVVVIFQQHRLKGEIDGLDEDFSVMSYNNNIRDQMVALRKKYRKKDGYR